MDRESVVSDSTTSTGNSLPPYSIGILQGELLLPNDFDPRHFAGIYTKNQRAIVSLPQQLRVASLNQYIDFADNQNSLIEQRPLVSLISCYYCQKHNQHLYSGNPCFHYTPALNISKQQVVNHVGTSQRSQSDSDEDSASLISSIRMPTNDCYILRQQSMSHNENVALKQRQLRQAHLVSMIPSKPAMILPSEKSKARKRKIVRPFILWNLISNIRKLK
ncbi:hypothetical protein MP228_010339 [Amoeboaphelidium protococcarum]|nr:hypothetical protein MP228_010339 [Amoeboaphelidium protococcarum]